MSTVSAVCQMPDYDVSGPYLSWPIYIEVHVLPSVCNRNKGKKKGGNNDNRAGLICHVWTWSSRRALS